MPTSYGMVGLGEWSAEDKADTYRKKILEISPNGTTILTGITSMLPVEKTDSEKIHWSTRTLPTQAGAVTGIYLEPDFTTAYVYATHQATRGIKGSVVYIKAAEATVKMFREGHGVLLVDSDQYAVDVHAKVVGVFFNGDNSYIACRLREADDNGNPAATYNLSTVDRIRVHGNINPQGGVRPPAIAYQPTWLDNVTHIWRTALDMTRTAVRVKLRNRDAYLDTKGNSLLLHGLELEKDLIWSIKDATSIGANGQPEFTIMGILEFIKTYAPSNVDDFSLNTDYAGKDWIEAGDDWLSAMMKQIASKTSDTPGNLGSDEWLCLCGAGALLGIQKLTKALGIYILEKGTAGYGIKIIEWNTVFGTFHLKVHPIFSWEPTCDYAMLILRPRNIKWRPLDETFFKPDDTWHKGGGVGVDGPQEEYLTEGTYEYYFADEFGYLNGVGKDSLV